MKLQSYKVSVSKWICQQQWQYEILPQMALPKMQQNAIMPNEVMIYVRTH
jgi:hypothetical protein